MEQTIGSPDTTARSVAGPLGLGAEVTVTGVPRKYILDQPLGLDTSGQ